MDKNLCQCRVCDLQDGDLQNEQTVYILYCVPAMTAKCILFHNHRKRIVVGGTYNVLVHYVDVNAPDPSGVAICNHFHMRYVLLYKNVSFLCVVLCSV